MDIGERKRLIEQTKKEVIAELDKYLVGGCQDGVMRTFNENVKLTGAVYIVPFDKREEWVKDL